MVQTIDLHPEKVGGQGPESALKALRAFLDKALKAGHREVRIITGLGLRGDGTPRLRTRVEGEVLGAYFRFIEAQDYEQGGAVIRLRLKPPPQKPAAAWHRHQRHRSERERVAVREQRLEIAYERLEAAEDALEEGDLRRVRLKGNQAAREFGWRTLEKAPSNVAEAAGWLDGLWAELRKADAKPAP